MKFNSEYEPKLSEEKEAYFHGQVYSLLRIQAGINSLRENMAKKFRDSSHQEYIGFELALLNVTRMLKEALEEIENEI